MRKFVWRLQRVLDIRKMQEQKARSELLALTQKLVAARGELLLQKKILENLIKSLACNNPKKRLAEQEFFLANSTASNEKIKIMKEKIRKLESQQKQKIAEVLKLRKAKEGMEKLKDQAKEDYIKEQEKIEQTELDEEATVLFVRNHR
jgi:flagellar biosynthesis chaperone FliJ